MEHTESAIDEQNNPSDEKQGGKMPNIMITSDNSPTSAASELFIHRDDKDGMFYPLNSFSRDA